MSMIFTCSLLGEDLVLACGNTSNVAEHLEFAVPEEHGACPSSKWPARQDTQWFSCDEWDKSHIEPSDAKTEEPSEAGSDSTNVEVDTDKETFTLRVVPRTVDGRVQDLRRRLQDVGVDDPDSEAAGSINKLGGYPTCYWRFLRSCNMDLKAAEQKLRATLRFRQRQGMIQLMDQQSEGHTRKVQPIKVDLEDEDQVIETCTSYEEAFLGYKPKGSTFPTLSPPVMVPSCLLPLVPSQASQMTPAPVQPVDRTARPKRPRLEVIHQASSESPQMPRMEAAEVGIFSQDQTISEAPSESESFADLPKEFLLPDAPAEAKAPVVPEPVQPPPATPATFDEEAEESLPAVPYSQAYVERLRNNAEEDCCCICRKVFIADQVRLGYTPHNGNEARWLHLRCLADDGLQMEPGDWLAFSPGIGVEERQRVLTILSIRRPMRPMDSHTGPLSWSPRLWCHCPAISQRWPRCRVPRAGATRAAPRLNLRYVAPVLSTVSQQARAVLLRERHRRLQAAGRQVVPPVPLARRPASGPSAVARRAQVTASSRRPNTQVEPVAETETRSGRRQWQRRSALGERAKELFAVVFERLKDAWPEAWIGTTSDGSPVSFFDVGKAVRFLQLGVAEDELRLFWMFWMERSNEQQRNGLARASGSIDPHDMPGTVVIYDLKELLLSSLTSCLSGLHTLVKVLGLAEKHYPSNLRKAIVLNAPTIFSRMVWPLVHKVLDSETRNNVSVCDSLEGLQLAGFSASELVQMMNEGSDAP
ncbi:unnamed protein product [Durusdinium trenchii]|uniref:CRAL-TRIO domain-containing protein n=1 Tax=Durusdinium trenchii TaxID=1381693 RepID=A0ABP0MYN1_9DINO